MRTIYLDTEITGLDPVQDEILEIGILSDTGEALLNTLVKPERHRQWPEAQRIHGITPAAVAQASTLVEVRPRIIETVSGSQVVIYNASFADLFPWCLVDFGLGELTAASFSFPQPLERWMS